MSGNLFFRTPGFSFVFGWARLQLKGQRFVLRSLSQFVDKDIVKLRSRGVFQSVFPEENTSQLQHLVSSSPQCVYCGFDPTADSLHVGNLLAIMALLHCQRGGHRAIVLLGGATALIGDPSGRTTKRNPMTSSQVEANVSSIGASIDRILINHQNFIWKEQSHDLGPVKVVNNADWYVGRGVVDFLADVGQHFRMGTMLLRHSVASRLQSEEGMSFTEFTYQVFQSYDWYHLLKTHGCNIQIGGHDQTGNIVAGHDFISRVSDQKVYGLTVPLITSSTGHKLGKSEGNSVWLNPDRTSPYQLYQYFFNLPDADVEKYLKLFTFLSHSEMQNIMEKQQGSPESRIGQRTVAEQVTLLVHGETGLETARRWSEALFGGSVDALEALSQSELEQLYRNAPSTELAFEQGLTLRDLCMKAGCFRREVDAERVIKQGGISVNTSRITQPEHLVSPAQHMLRNNVTLIRLGKKTYHIIKWVL